MFTRLRVKSFLLKKSKTGFIIYFTFFNFRNSTHIFTIISVRFPLASYWHLYCWPSYQPAIIAALVVMTRLKLVFSIPAPERNVSQTINTGTSQKDSVVFLSLILVYQNVNWFAWKRAVNKCMSWLQTIPKDCQMLGFRICHVNNKMNSFTAMISTVNRDTLMVM